MSSSHLVAAKHMVPSHTPKGHETLRVQCSATANSCTATRSCWFARTSLTRDGTPGLFMTVRTGWEPYDRHDRTCHRLAYSPQEPDAFSTAPLSIRVIPCEATAVVEDHRLPPHSYDLAAAKLLVCTSSFCKSHEYLSRPQTSA